MDAPVNMDGVDRTKSCNVEPTKRYRHQALDTSTRQIRLIKLRPGRSKQPQCDISVFDLGSAPPFVALSYTWGPPSPQFDILVNGESLSIRDNLFQFFQAYLKITEEDFQQLPPPKWSRHWEPRGTEYLWIDQICIDQSSVHERNHQVGMMASIYAGCHGTIIWLADIRGCPDAPLLLGDPNARDYGWTAKTYLPEPIASVSGDEYFTRLWIVQEVILSTRRKVLCSHPIAGPVWICWDGLSAEAKCYPGHVSSESARYLLDHHDHHDQMDLSDAIKTFKESRCQDPRDKVYALMGLVKEEQRLQIDYGKPLEELLLDIMTIFYAASTQRSYYPKKIKCHQILKDLGRTWGIMSASLDALLADIWPSPHYGSLRRDGHESNTYRRFSAMGFFPKALHKKSTSKWETRNLEAYSSPWLSHSTAMTQRRHGDNELTLTSALHTTYTRGDTLEEREVSYLQEPLLPYSSDTSQNPGDPELYEWITMEDCWWYQIDTIYKIYGLVNWVPGHDKDTMPNAYYGERVERVQTDTLASLVPVQDEAGDTC